MIILICGLLLFFAPHLLRELGLRQKVIKALPSEGAYKGLYSLAALAGLGLIIWGKAAAEFIMIWQPVYELRYISLVLMIPAMVLVAAGNMPASYLRKYLRNPMLLGVAFWGLAHLWANGDLASMVLFGSFTLWAGFKFVVMGFDGNASSKKPSLFWDILSIIIGLVIYASISIYHGQLFGVGLSFA